MTELLATAAALDAASAYHSIRLGWPEDRTGWVRCADVDAEFVARWERRLDPYLIERYQRSHPMTVSGFALDFYAHIPGVLGGGAFRLARRVLRLDRSSVAFHVHDHELYPDAIALLDERFWCLASDPAADTEAATVVEDEAALAGILRAQVRSHADDFLARCAGGAELPRRRRLGAFFDGLDAGIWLAGDGSAAAAEEVLATTAVVLPGGTREFDEPSSVHLLTDPRGRQHLSMRRVGCCYYYKVAPAGTVCATCPRLDDASRARRYAELET